MNKREELIKRCKQNVIRHGIIFKTYKNNLPDGYYELFIVKVNILFLHYFWFLSRITQRGAFKNLANC